MKRDHRKDGTFRRGHTAASKGEPREMWSGRLPLRTHEKLRAVVEAGTHKSQADAVAAAVDALSSANPSSRSDGSAISRQRRWQIARTKEGRCQICGKPNLTAMLCAEHAEKNRTIGRNRYRAKQGVPISTEKRKSGRKPILPNAETSRSSSANNRDDQRAPRT